MLSVDEALRAVMERSAPLPPRLRPLGEVLGCVLGEEVAADIDSPPFDKALVDGYAVRSGDLAGPDRRLVVGEEITAGRTPTRPLGPREAALIMTGAPLPPGADAVVMLERTCREDSAVLVEEPAVPAGANRLTRGREMRAGEVVLRPGTCLTPVRIGLLATVGRRDVSVVPRPCLCVVSTGDELVEPDQVPGPGQIRNSNGLMLTTLAESRGAEVETLPNVPDQPQPLAEALRRGLQSDVLVITGGVSAGTRDLVPETLERLRVTRVFHKIRLKPGKPLWFGVGPPRGDGPGTLVFGLPGNPVSGVVGFLLFVRPALEALAGRAPRQDGLCQLRLGSSYVHKGDRPTYHPAVYRDGLLEPLPWAGSADLRTVAAADGFAVFPPGEHSYAPGDVVAFLPLD
jgi:molybdopterin molybdotransferase